MEDLVAPISVQSADRTSERPAGTKRGCRIEGSVRGKKVRIHNTESFMVHSLCHADSYILCHKYLHRESLYISMNIRRPAGIWLHQLVRPLMDRESTLLSRLLREESLWATKVEYVLGCACLHEYFLLVIFLSRSIDYKKLWCFFPCDYIVVLHTNMYHIVFLCAVKNPYLSEEIKLFELFIFAFKCLLYLGTKISASSMSMSLDSLSKMSSTSAVLYGKQRNNYENRDTLGFKHQMLSTSAF